MIHAYDKVYLSNARTVFARMLDFAVYDLKYNIEEFFSLFLSSGVATRFEEGDYEVLVGKSGVELAYEVLDFAGVNYERAIPQYTVERSEEYWVGHYLAYYQWYSRMHFSKIVECVPIRHLRQMYSKYHEMDILHFVERMDQVCHEERTMTRLKAYRLMAGLSQKELAEKTEVPIRTIQQYEQRQKNINKAQVEYLIHFSKALYCEPEDLLERIE